MMEDFIDQGTEFMGIETNFSFTSKPEGCCSCGGGASKDAVLWELTFEAGYVHQNSSMWTLLGQCQGSFDYTFASYPCEAWLMVDSIESISAREMVIRTYFPKSYAFIMGALMT